MSVFFTTDPLDSVDMLAFRANSRQAFELVEGDAHSLRAEMARVWPNQANPPIRPSNLLSRYAEEQSQLYRHPVFREWGGCTPAQAAKLDDIYANSGISQSLHDLHRHLAIQGTAIVAVLPDGVRRYRLMWFLPYEASVTPAGGADVPDITRAKEVSLRFPLGTVDDQWCYYGMAKFTQAEAWIEGNGLRSPIFGSSTVNPFGRIPLLVARLTLPKKGRFWGPMVEDVVYQTIALSLQDSDVETVLHHQGWGQQVLRPGSNAALPPAAMVDKLPRGPNRLFVLPGEGSTYEIVQGEVPIDAHIALQESKLRTVATLHNLSPSRFATVNTQATDAARKAELADQEKTRQGYRRIFEPLESGILRIICELSNIHGDPVPLPLDATVVVRYPEYAPPSDPLREAQAVAITDQTGETSVVDRVAAQRNCSREEARAIIEDRLRTLGELEKIRGRAAPMAGNTLESGDNEPDGTTPADRVSTAGTSPTQAVG